MKFYQVFIETLIKRLEETTRRLSTRGQTEKTGN